MVIKKGFQKEIKVGWCDLDAAQVVWTPNYLKWMGEAIYEFFKTRGIYRTVDNDCVVNGNRIGSSYLNGEIFLRIKAPSIFEDILILATSIKEIGSKKMTFEFLLTHKESGKLLAEGYMIIVWIDREKKRAKEIPPVIISLLQQ